MALPGPLVSIANASDLETQRCIAYALCNLAAGMMNELTLLFRYSNPWVSNHLWNADPSRRIDIVREGGLSSIISMACSEDQNDQRAAMSTLRGHISLTSVLLIIITRFCSYRDMRNP